jgi:hypothetical protein
MDRRHRGRRESRRQVNGEISFRKGRPGDLRATFGLCERAVADTGRRWPAGAPAEQTEAAIEAKWRL